MYLADMSALPRQQWELGEAAGMATLIALPHTIIETHSQERDELMKKLTPDEDQNVSET
ncbi:MAG: hypothetical protein ABIU97_05255 [Dehalococcoidia bacterium]